MNEFKSNPLKTAESLGNFFLLLFYQEKAVNEEANYDLLQKYFNNTHPQIILDTGTAVPKF